MGGLTPGVTQITLRDLATMMVAVSDNSATNVLIDRVGMENVNAFLKFAGAARHPPSPQDDGPQGGQRRPRKCIHAKRDGESAAGSLSAAKILNKEMTDDFFKVLCHAQRQLDPARPPRRFEDRRQAGRARRRPQRFGRDLRRQAPVHSVRHDDLPASRARRRRGDQQYFAGGLAYVRSDGARE